MSFRKIAIQKGSKIQYSSSELLFLAKSGQPYRGTLYINFTSKGEGFDMRDFKTYLTSLRSMSLNAEDIAYEIYTKVAESVTVKDLGIIVDLTARGGIQQRISFGADFDVVQKPNMFQVG